MFHVVVLGGVALVGCGGAVESAASMPASTTATLDASAPSPSRGLHDASPDVTFPSELALYASDAAALVDASGLWITSSNEAGPQDAGAGIDAGFRMPWEGPPPR